MKVLVCLPTYNEEENVEFMIERLREENLEIVVCDGHSTDQTIPIAQKMGVKVLHRKGFGKGSAIIEAAGYAIDQGYDRLVTIDCDRTYQSPDIKRLLQYSQEYDMVVGARSMKDIAFLRRMANYLMTWVLNVLFMVRVKDMATGLRVFDPAKFLPFLSADSFDIEPQIYAVALREGFSSTEIPITYHRRIGSSKIRLKHLFLIIYRMVIERFKK